MRKLPLGSRIRSGLGGLAALLLPAAALAGALPEVSRAPERSRDLVLELRLGEYTLHDSLLARREEGTVFYPLGALARHLELPIKVRAGEGKAEGWLPRSEREVALDVADGTVRVGEDRFRLGGEQFRVHPEDIYLAAETLVRILPVKLRLRSRKMRLELAPDGPLPVLERLRREQQWQEIRERPLEKGQAPLAEYGLRALSLPSWYLSLDHWQEGRAHRPSRTEGVFQAAGDVLYHQGSVYASTRDDRLLRLDMTLAKDFDRRWLTRYEGGRVWSPAADMLTENSWGTGIVVTNASDGEPASGFQDHTIEGNAPKGWSAELYRNGQLVDYIQSLENGRYRFTGVQVEAGENRFDVVLYGPRGQTRTEHHTVHTGPGMLPPGRIQYDAGWLRPGESLAGEENREIYGVDNGRGRIRVAGGVTSWLTAGVDLHVSQDPEAGQHPERAAGLDLAGSLGLTAWRMRHARDGEGGRAEQISLFRSLGSWSGRLAYITANGLDTEDLGEDLRRRVEARASGPVGDWFFLRGDYEEDTRRSGTGERRLRLYQTASLGGVRWGHRLTGEREGKRRDRLYGSLDASRFAHRRQFGMGLRYRVRPETRLEQLRASWNQRLNGAVTTRLEGRKGLAEGYYDSVSAGVAGRFRRLRLGVDGTLREQGEWYVTVGLELGGVPVPQEGGYRIRGDAEDNIRSGGVAVRVLEERDGEAVPREGAAVRAAGREAATGPDGIALLTGLDPRQRHDVRLDMGSIENPFVRRIGEERSIRPRPGVVQGLEYRVGLTGEVEGTLKREQGGDKAPVPGVRVVARDAEGNRAATARTAFDGLFILDRLLPGTYTIAVHPDDAERLGVPVAATKRQVRLPAGGEIVNGVDILF